MIENEDVPSGGLVTGVGLAHGRLVAVVANDATVKGGTYFPITVKKHLRLQVGHRGVEGGVVRVATVCDCPGGALLDLMGTAGSGGTANSGLANGHCLLCPPIPCPHTAAAAGPLHGRCCRRWQRGAACRACT